MATYNPFADELFLDSKQKEDDARRALIAAYSQPSMDPQASFGAALGGALPAIIGGLFGGKYGLQSGAQGGALGAKYGFDLAQAEGERRQKLGVQEASIALDDARDSRKGAIQTQRDEIKAREAEDRQSRQFEQQDKITGERNVAMESRLLTAMGGTENRAAERNEISRDTQARLEAEALDKDVINNASIAKGKAVLNSSYRIKQILSKPLNQVTLGALRTQIPRFNEEVGNLAQAEQKSAVPGTLREKATAAVNFLQFGADNEVVPAELQKALVQYVDALDVATKKRLSKEIDALEKAADITAPYLAKKAPENIKRKFDSYRSQILESIEEGTAGSNLSSEEEDYKQQYKQKLLQQKLGGG